MIFGHVSFKVLLLGECFLAHLTLVWFLSCVNSAVSVQISFPVKGGQTSLTPMRFLSCMHLHMLYENCLSGYFHSTYLTHPCLQLLTVFIWKYTATWCSISYNLNIQDLRERCNKTALDNRTIWRHSQTGKLNDNEAEHQMTGQSEDTHRQAGSMTMKQSTRWQDSLRTLTDK